MCAEKHCASLNYDCAHICALARFGVSSYECRKTLHFYYDCGHTCTLYIRIMSRF